MSTISPKRLYLLFMVAALLSLPIAWFMLPTETISPPHPAKRRLDLAQEGDASAQFSLGLDYERARGIPQDLTQAIRWFQASAEQGFAKAQSNLGTMYYQGKGVPKDIEKAKYWYEKAAMQNEVTGLHNYGHLLDYEENNMAEALKWYHKAVEAGSAESMLELGLAYSDGRGGLSKDYRLAMDWYLKSANAGLGMAENNIGSLYHNGQGVPVDYQKAMEWYQKAAAKGEALAQRNIGSLYFYGNGVAVDFIAAREWFQKAASQNEAKAISWIAYMDFAGLAAPQNMETSFHAYEKAAELGNVEAMQTLAWFYEHGKGTAQNHEKAQSLYANAFQEAKRSYEKNKDYTVVLADSYYYGQGTDENKVEAMRLYEEAAAAGDNRAEYMIGRAYFEGEAGYQQDSSKGLDQLKKAAEHGNYDAYRHLAYAYCAGKGVERDRKQSRNWLEQSASRGDPIAKEMLERRTEAEFLSILIDAVSNASPIFTLLR